MTDYIKRDAVIDYLDSNNMPWRDWVKDIPSADVVSREAYEQTKWERDTAIAQLEELGYGLGEERA